MLDYTEKILALTSQIHTEYPELVKYLEEMPITIPNEANPSMNESILEGYYETLLSFYKHYKHEKVLHHD